MSDLKEIGKLRKAMLPLFKILGSTMQEGNDKRLDLLERKLEKLTIPQPEVKVNIPKPETPIVKVAPPEVVVNMDIEKIVKALEQSVVKNTTYEPHDQSEGGIFTYAGFVSLDGGWYIQRIVKDEQRYSKGDGEYQDAWEKRDKLKYGYLDG